MFKFKSDHFIRNSFEKISPVEYLNKYHNINNSFLRISVNKIYCEQDSSRNFSKFEKIESITREDVNPKEHYQKLFQKMEFSNSAIIVPYECLKQLKGIHYLNIKKFESFEDFWSPGESYFHSKLIPKFKYEHVANLCDPEFWKLHLENVVNLNVDCIIYSTPHSPEFQIMKVLANNMWEGGEGEPGFSIKPGIRKTEPIEHPNFLMHTISEFEFEPYRFPTFGGGIANEIVEMWTHKLSEVCNNLKKTWNGCGWFTGNPSFTMLTFLDNQKNQLVNVGDEHKLILPFSCEEAFECLNQTDKVKFIKSRIGLDVNFKDDESKIPSLQEIFDFQVEIVVFYCNNCSSNSPREGKEYFQWLRKNHPESTQRVMLLENGINGLYNYIQNKYPEKLKHIFSC
jgi:hypothetical protein